MAQSPSTISLPHSCLAVSQRHLLNTDHLIHPCPRSSSLHSPSTHVTLCGSLIFVLSERSPCLCLLSDRRLHHIILFLPILLSRDQTGNLLRNVASKYASCLLTTRSTGFALHPQSLPSFLLLLRWNHDRAPCTKVLQTNFGSFLEWSSLSMLCVGWLYFKTMIISLWFYCDEYVLIEPLG